jgi:hypothetical protein
VRQADIKKSCFYIGGNGHRIREVTNVISDFMVEWRDIDPETVDWNWLAQKDGRCEPRTFAKWGKRQVSSEEVQARLAMPKAERMQLSARTTHEK